MDPVMDYIMGWSTPALICLIAGLILMVCEMFTPGMGIPGILGGLCLLGAIVLRADSLTTALITLILILLPLMIAAGIIFRSFSKGALSRSRIVLKDSIDGESTPLGDKDAQSLIGLEGRRLFRQKAGYSQRGRLHTKGRKGKDHRHRRRKDYGERDLREI